MEKNKDYDLQNGQITVENNLKTFLLDLIRGLPIGVAFIIPGFSGGSVAAILGIYEKMIYYISTVFRNMKKSIITLLPIGIGIVLGAVSLLFPISLALDAFPLPTVSLFVGLAIGGMPSVTDKIPGKPTRNNIIAFSLPFVFALALSFIPVGSDVNLFGLDFGGYVLLFLVGMLGSTALVVPGISGSMLLLILGYYNPILKLITEHLFKGRDFWTSVLVLGTCAAGIGIGFLITSFIMRILIEKYQRGTYFAIVGFIVGSLPTVYISTMKSVGMLSSAMSLQWIPSSPLHWICVVLMIVIGSLASYTLVGYGRKISEKREK